MDFRSPILTEPLMDPGQVYQCAGDPERITGGLIGFSCFLECAPRSIELFEVYSGEGVPEGRKSVNFTVTLGAMDRTLSAKDEERFLQRVRDGAKAIGAELRDASAGAQ